MKLKILLGVFIAAFLLALSGMGRAEDTRYEVVEPYQATQSGDRIEVVEFFWYGCPHCYSVEPYLEHWNENKPEDVEFRRVPGVLSGKWIPHARAFYTAEKLGVLEKIHRPLFDAIHKDRQRISNQDHLADFFADYDVDKAEFNRIYESEAVTDQIKQAYLAAKSYSITGVPTLIVNGKYRTTVSQAGSNKELIATINDLIDRERQGN